MCVFWYIANGGIIENVSTWKRSRIESISEHPFCVNVEQKNRLKKERTERKERKGKTAEEAARLNADEEGKAADAEEAVGMAELTRLQKEKEEGEAPDKQV